MSTRGGRPSGRIAENHLVMFRVRLDMRFSSAPNFGVSFAGSLQTRKPSKSITSCPEILAEATRVTTFKLYVTRATLQNETAMPQTSEG